MSSALSAAAQPDIDELQGMETLITTGAELADHYNPEIHSDRIVWEDYRNGDADIFMYNISSGIETQITTDPSDQVDPAIFGDYIVWQDYRDGNGNIFLHDIRTGIETRITNGSSEHASPAIYGDRILWRDDRDGKWNIYLHDIGTGIETRITTNDSSPFDFSICQDHIVWSDSRDGKMEIYFDNITSAEEKALTTSSIVHTDPSISGNWISWTELAGMNYNIVLYSLLTGETSVITADMSSADQPNARIDGDRVVWTYSDGIDYGDIYLYEISSGKTYRVTSNGEQQKAPAIDGDRIVWEDYRNGHADIYLFTIGAQGSCPVADFEANATIGLVPLAVQFNDRSTEIPQTWHWNFGDGNTSDEQNPVHTFAANGSYSISLAISTPNCSDTAVKEDFISVGSPPVPDFSVAPTDGPSPLMVQFTDLSAGDPTFWEWNFGDGNYSLARNPNHTYTIPGFHNVTLISGNQFGNATLMKPRLINVVPGESKNTTTVFDGLTIVESDGIQRAACNTTKVTVLFDPADNSTLVLSPPNSTGLREIILISEDGTGFWLIDNTTITGNLTGVKIRSLDIQNDEFGDDVGGPCPVNYTLGLPFYPVNGSIVTNLWEGVTPTDSIKVAAAVAKPDTSFGGVWGSAYTARFTKDNITVNGPATVMMAVNATWRRSHSEQYGFITHPNGSTLFNGVTNRLESSPEGADVWIDGSYIGTSPVSPWLNKGKHYVTFKKAGYYDNQVTLTVYDDSMRIIHIADDGSSEILNTTFLYSDPASNLDYFEAESPNGTSTFVLSGLYRGGNPLQLLYTFILSAFQGPPSNGGGGGGGGEPYHPPPTVIGTPKPTQTGPTQTVPPKIQPTASTPVPGITGTQPPQVNPSPGETAPPAGGDSQNPPPQVPPWYMAFSLPVFAAVCVLFVAMFALRWQRKREQ